MADKFKVSQHDTRTLSWWRSRRDRIDMDPPYQRRGRLWSSTDKAYLIDSIINGFDVPKLYIADFSWGASKLNKKKLPYAIVDGKQRLEAIFDFFDGKIVLNDDFVYRLDTSLKLGGLGYADLRQNYPEIAEEFENFPPVVMTIVASDDGPINELFLRLNRSKPLTGAEIRNAMSGPAPDVIRNIGHHEFFASNIRFKVSRGEDLNTAAKLLMFEYFGGTQETKKANLDNFVKGAEKIEKTKLELAGRHVIETLDDMSRIFLPSDALLSSSGVIPVYYWFVRNTDQSDYYRIREFLVGFDDERKKNRDNLNTSSGRHKIDAELAEYDNYNRSTNDAKSHAERFRILIDRFKGKSVKTHSVKKTSIGKKE